MNKEILLEEIRIRDPFIHADKEKKQYFLYGTTDENPWEGEGKGFQYYTSTDLRIWKGPYDAFLPEPTFWGKENFWAPEVHRYGDAYYMLASFTAPGVCRGVQVLKTKDLSTPFLPLKNEAITPKNWECLDGTLYVDNKETPWLIFSHEWTQIQDGEICCMELSKDLMEAKGEPKVLFRASDAVWTRPVENLYGYKKAYVTDGPYIYVDQQKRLKMIWSSFGKDGYAVGRAYSQSGCIVGPWVQEETPIFRKDGGHAMIFSDFNESKYMVLHAPNETPKERTILIKLTGEEA